MVWLIEFEYLSASSLFGPLPLPESCTAVLHSEYPTQTAAAEIPDPWQWMPMGASAAWLLKIVSH